MENHLNHSAVAHAGNRAAPDLSAMGAIEFDMSSVCDGDGQVEFEIAAVGWDGQYVQPGS